MFWFLAYLSEKPPYEVNMPDLKEVGYRYIALHISVSMSVCLSVDQMVSNQ